MLSIHCKKQMGNASLTASQMSVTAYPLSKVHAQHHAMPAAQHDTWGKGARRQDC